MSEPEPDVNRDDPLTGAQEPDTLPPMPKARRRRRASRISEEAQDYDPVPEPSSPEELALACMQGPPKRRRDWRYLQKGQPKR